MKITPINENQIKVETDKGIFYVYSLVGGGLEIHSQEGKTLTHRGLDSAGISHQSKVIIKED